MGTIGSNVYTAESDSYIPWQNGLDISEMVKE